MWDIPQTLSLLAPTLFSWCHFILSSSRFCFTITKRLRECLSEVEQMVDAKVNNGKKKRDQHKRKKNDKRNTCS